MDSSFNLSLAKLLDMEGVISDHPLDSGGLTKWGVTQATYDRYRTMLGLSKQSVAVMPYEEMRGLYYNLYWRPVGAASLPEGLDFVVFQAAVNIGQTTAVRMLQRVLGVTADGVVGPQTLAAVNVRGVSYVIDAFLRAQSDYYGRIVSSNPSQAAFYDGWLNRVEGALDYVRETWQTATGIGFFS